MDNHIMPNYLQLAAHVVAFFLVSGVTTGFTCPARTQPLSRFAFDHNVLKSSAAEADLEPEKAAPTSAQLGAWIPLGSASCLDGLTPTQVQVCGLDLVVWQTDAKKGDVGTFSAFMDACPHRLAPLSQGRVDSNTGCLGGWKLTSLLFCLSS